MLFTQDLVQQKPANMIKNTDIKPADSNEDFSDGSDDSEDYRNLTSTDRALLSGSAKSKYLFKNRHRNFAEDCLDAHNRMRATHLTDPLELDEKLCRICRIWARYLANQGQLESRYNNPYGENLFLIWPTNVEYTVKGTEPVDVWYSGMQDYTFGLDPSNMLCLQFTQLVWRDTTKLGVGIARGNDGKIFVVAIYEPCGNVMGEFATQVPPPGGCAEDAQWQVVGGSGKHFTSAQRECLQLHNDLRRRHGVPLLTLNAALSKMATAWADQLAEEDRHAYRVDNPLGENVFSSALSDAEARSHGGGVQAAVDAWYEEIKFFDFGLEPLDIKARNFTQMMWRSSRYLGVGVARGRGGRVVIVANYYPRGNVVGQYRDNVPPPHPVTTVAPAATITTASTSEEETPEQSEE